MADGDQLLAHAGRRREQNVTMLRERYITAVLDKVPESQRDEVRIEIGAAIDEMVDKGIKAGEPEEVAAEQALNELGDPSALAASYQDRPNYLIGPGWYPAYIFALKRIPAIVLPIVATITFLVGLGLDGATLPKAIQSSVESVFFAAVQILFWVTLGFVIAERVVGPDMPSTEDKAWTVANLPEVPARRQISLTDTLMTVITLVIFGAFAIIGQSRGLGAFLWRGEAGDMDSMPILNPDLGTVWAVGFFALLALSIGVPLVRYAKGNWTTPMLVATCIESTLWIVFLAVLAAREPIFNPDLVRRLDLTDDRIWGAAGSLEITTVGVLIVITLWDTWEAIRGHREYQRVYKPLPE